MVTQAFNTLSQTPAIFRINLNSATSGVFDVTLSLTTGVNGGSDDPVVTVGPFPFVTAYLPTYNNSLAHFFGEPISSATGELYAPPVPPDLALGGPLPLNFERYYASQTLASGIVTRIGNNWMHNFEWLLSLNGSQATVTQYGAKTITFNQSAGNWMLAYPDQFGYQFVSPSANTYQFLDPRTNLIYTFSGTGSTVGNTSIQDRNGNTLTIALPSNGSSQVTDGLGRSLTLTYDSNNRLMKVADQTGRFVSYGYTGNDLTQFTNANGKMETYTYTTAGSEIGLMTSAPLPLGNKPQSQTWDQNARVVTQTDSLGNMATMTYDQPPGSAAYKDPTGVSTTDTSENYSDFLTYTDPDAHMLSVAYDSTGRRNSVTDRMGNNISMTFHVPSGYVASVTNANGNTTTNTWQPQVSGPFTFYVLTKVLYADGTSTSYTYDPSGNVLTATDQAGKVTKYTYNSRGQELTETDPVGRVAKSTYNADGTLASFTDAAGNMTTYGYDALKRGNLITFPDGTTQSTTYDNLDHVVASGRGSGNGTTYTFNDNGKLQSTSNGSGSPSTTTYDTNDHILKETDGLGASTSYVYNQLGLNKSITTPLGLTYTFNYDAHHRLSGWLDPSGNGLSFGYDKEDAPATVTDALSRKILFTADPLGLLTQVTTPLGENYSIIRDKLQQVTSVTDPSGIATSATYDPRGLVNGISVGGLSSTFLRDDSGLFTGVTDPNGKYWTYGYDTGGRLSTRTDPLARSTAYSYDVLDRLIGAQMPIGSVAFTLNSGGDILRRLYSDGTDLNYTYGGGSLTAAPGLMLSYNAEHQITGSNGLDITVDADGRAISITYAVGKTVNYTYTPVGLLGSVTDWIGGSTTFTYDAAHQLILMKRPNGLGTAYTYDPDGNLASITEDAGSSIMVQRNAAGKVLSETRTQPQFPMLASGMLPLAFDAADQVAGFNYDALGRLNADFLRTYQWDLASRLTSYSGVDGAATATYDGLGYRTSQTSSAGVRNFIWDYSTSIPSLATVQNGSADYRYYVYEPSGSLLYSIDAATNARHFYHFDEYGSTVLLTNETGGITDSYGISPYGETVTQNGSTDNPFTWLGQWGVMQEGSTSLYYMRSRFYDSATARFLSPTPVWSADPQRVNPYQYGLANPLAFADPTGLAATGFDPFAGQTQRGSASLNWYGNAGPSLRDYIPGPASYEVLSGYRDSGSYNTTATLAFERRSSATLTPLQSGWGSNWGCGPAVFVGVQRFISGYAQITYRPKPDWMLQGYGARIPQTGQYFALPVVAADLFSGAIKTIQIPTSPRNEGGARATLGGPPYGPDNPLPPPPGNFLDDELTKPAF